MLNPQLSGFALHADWTRDPTVTLRNGGSNLCFGTLPFRDPP